MAGAVTDRERMSHFRDGRQQSCGALPESLSFADLGFDGLGRRKSPISMWLGARGACMQFTNFFGRCATSRTRYGQCLLEGEVTCLHAI
jgi:hypothetical protein